MARKPTEETRELQRRAHEVLTHAGPGAELKLKEIAEALGVETKVLSNALPVRGKIVRVKFGTYAAWTKKSGDDVTYPAMKRSVAAHDAVASLDGTTIVATLRERGQHPTFRLIHVLNDGEILLQDEDKNVWKATLL